MDGNVVSAAKWFGGCLIVCALILVIGFDIAMYKSVRPLGKSIDRVGSNLRPSHSSSFPSSITLRHSVSGGPLGIDLSPNGSDIEIAPIEVELVRETAASDDAN